MSKSFSIKLTKSLGVKDFSLLSQEKKDKLLSNKFVIKYVKSTDDNDTIEEIFEWLSSNCQNYYYVDMNNEQYQNSLSQQFSINMVTNGGFHQIY